MTYLALANRLMVIAAVSATPSLSRADDSVMAAVYKLVSFPKLEVDASCVKIYQQGLPELMRVGSATVFSLPDHKKTFAVTAAHVPYHENSEYCHMIISPSTSEVLELRLKHVDLSVDLALLEVLGVARKTFTSISLSNGGSEPSTVPIGTQLHVVGVPAKSQMIRWYPGTVTTSQSDLPSFRAIKSFETNANSVVGMSGGAAFVNSGIDNSTKFAGILSAQILISSDAGRYIRMIPVTSLSQFLSRPTFSTIVISRDQVISFVEQHWNSNEEKSTWIYADPALQKSNITSVQIDGVQFTDQSCVARERDEKIGGSFAGIGGSFAGIGGGQNNPEQHCSIDTRIVSDGTPHCQLESRLSSLRDAIAKVPSQPNMQPEVRFYDPSARIEERPESVFAALGMLRAGLVPSVTYQDPLQTQLRSDQSPDSRREHYLNIRTRNDFAMLVAWSKLSNIAKVYAWADLEFEQRIKLHSLRESMFSESDLKFTDDFMKVDETKIALATMEQGDQGMRCVWAKASSSYRIGLEHGIMRLCRKESESQCSDVMKVIQQLKLSPGIPTNLVCFVPKPVQKESLVVRLPRQTLSDDEAFNLAIFQEIIEIDADLNISANRNGYGTN